VSPKIDTDKYSVDAINYANRFGWAVAGRAISNIAEEDVANESD